MFGIAAQAQDTADAGRVSPPPAPAVKPQEPATADLDDPNYVGEPLSLDIYDIKLKDFLRTLSDLYRVNFVPDPEVGALTVDVKCNKVPWDKVFRTVLKSRGLAFQIEHGLIRVAKVETLATEADAERRKRQSELIRNSAAIAFFPLRHIDAKEDGTSGIVELVKQNLTPFGNVRADERTNTLIVTDAAENLERIKKIVARLDIAQPQIEIEARIVVANRSVARDIGTQLAVGVAGRNGAGINLGTAPNTSALTPNSGPSQTPSKLATANGTNPFFLSPGGNGNLAGVGNTALNLTTGLIGTGYISFALNLAEQRGIAKTVSTPRVIALNNTKAKLESGRLVPFTSGQGLGNAVVSTTTFQNATLSIEAVPHVIDGNRVKLRLSITNDSVDRTTPAVNGQPPINKQSLTNEFELENGGSALIGGIAIDAESSTIQQTPGLGKIPLFGELFKRRQNARESNELLFFLTVRVTNGASEGVPQTVEIIRSENINLGDLTGVPIRAVTEAKPAPAPTTAKPDVPKLP
jgi:type IV pilus assembly protein PilQ